MVGTAEQVGSAGGQCTDDSSSDRRIMRELTPVDCRLDAVIGCGIAPISQPDHPHSRRRRRLLLPVQVVEQVRRHHTGRRHATPEQEPHEVQHVVRAGTDGGRREARPTTVTTRSSNRSSPI